VNKTIQLFLFCLIGFLNANSVEERIQKLLPPGIELNSFQDSELRNFYAVNVANNQVLYISKDFKYVFAGELIKFESSSPESLNDIYKQEYVLKALSQIDENEAIKFISNSESNVIRVFTDIKCAYCRIFHSEIDSYLNQGISIYYYAFPRDGSQSDSFNDMASAWCNSNRKSAITKLKLGEGIEELICDNPVETHFNAGRLMGVTGTPTIILEDGRMLTGYIPSKDLIKIIKDG
tara:strand:- start:287 stop:991 length:705 start_codon:yes stop_codon:yes gene_type:complete